MIGDYYRTSIPQQWGWTDKIHVQPAPEPFQVPDYVTKKELDELKKEMQQVKELLKRAKDYDAKNNEKDCEVEEKMEFLRKVAGLVGIDFDELLGKAK